MDLAMCAVGVTHPNVILGRDLWHGLGTGMACTGMGKHHRLWYRLGS